MTAGSRFTGILAPKWVKILILIRTIDRASQTDRCHCNYFLSMVGDNEYYCSYKSPIRRVHEVWES